MWSKKTVQHRDNAGGSVSGFKIGLHNWTHGINTPNGRFLSPENAIKALSEILRHSENGEFYVVVFLIAKTTVSEFKREIEQLNLILGESSLKQAFDYAKASENLAESKMIKTEGGRNPSFAGVADLTPKSGRVLQAILRKGESGGDPFKAIEKLKQRKAQKDAEKQQEIQRIKNAKATVYAFVSRGELDEIAFKLSENIPEAESIYTACICYIGDNLSNLKGLLR